MPCTLTSFPGSLEDKQSHNIMEPPPPPYLRTGYIGYKHSSFYAKPTYIFVSSDMIPVQVPDCRTFGIAEIKGYLKEIF